AARAGPTGAVRTSGSRGRLRGRAAPSPRAGGAGGAAGGSATRGGARLLRRTQPQRDRGAARRSARNGQDPHQVGNAETARGPRMKHHVLTDEQETTATLYALGTLDPDAAREFARHLADDECDVCRDHVAAMGGVCADLALAPAPAPPP